MVGEDPEHGSATLVSLASHSIISSASREKVPENRDQALFSECGVMPLPEQICCLLIRLHTQTI